MIYLLPGMGADSRMYGPEWRELDNFTFLDWPKYNGETTFQEVASRVIDECNLSSEDIVGGSSLGGMVAIEIMLQLSNPQLILLGSAVNPKEVNTLLRKLAPAAGVPPLGLIKILSGKYKSTLTSMFSDADTAFVKAMCLALPDWNGYTGSEDKVLRIHGGRDLVIKCQTNCSDSCQVISDAGHLVAMTHAMECIDIIKREIS